MAETQEGSLARHAVAAACLTFLFVARAAAQWQPQQPQVVPAPPSPEFLSRYDFHLSVDSLMPPKDTPEEIADERFSWETHFGGSFDVVDLVFARAGATIDYEAVEGSEYRPFDPNQGNYTLEGFVLARTGRFEVGPVFHHVSRHLGDRPKRQAIAWNELGGRVLDRREFGKTSLDVDLEGGYAVQHSFVDYTWISDARLLVKHPINGVVGIFGTAWGQLVGVNESLGRSTQTGGRVEVGVRVSGRGAVMELYVGYENRVDAYPLDHVPQHWALTGLRLVSR